MTRSREPAKPPKVAEIKVSRPDKVFFTAELPKTRSAKIMRRLLRDIGEGRVAGDTTTLADPAVLAQIRSQYEEKEG